MKKLTVILILIVITSSARCQNLNEWIRQKRTQKKYLQTQIAELKIYLELTEKGYKIAKEGLVSIYSIKNGEFKLHKNYFDSLLIVNPLVAGSPRTKNITDLHGHINDICTDGLGLLIRGGQLGVDELSYIKRVYDKVYDDSQVIIGSLLMLIRNGNLSMGDAGRLARIEVLYGQMLSNFRFVRSFQDQAALLIRQRAGETSQIQTSRQLNGIN